MIRISDEVAWRAAPWITERVIAELSDGMDEATWPGSPPTSLAVVDVRGLDPTAFRSLRQACAEALDIVFLRGPTRFLREEDFLDAVFELSRLELLLSLDPRSGRSANSEEAAAEFVLANAAAAFRDKRPSVAVLVLEAMPSHRGATGLEQLQQAERADLARILQSLQQDRFIAAALEDSALRSVIMAATDAVIRDVRQTERREPGGP